MAKRIISELKTDYTNDVFSGLRQYLISTDSGSGLSTIEDQTDYETEGDEIGAAVFNAICTAINRLNTLNDVTLLASGWSSSAPYTQTITVTGMVAGESYPNYQFNGTPNETQMEQFNFIGSAVAGTDNVTFTCPADKPTIDLPILLKGC